jgi:hypothetical protein
MMIAGLIPFLDHIFFVFILVRAFHVLTRGTTSCETSGMPLGHVLDFLSFPGFKVWMAMGIPLSCACSGTGFSKGDLVDGMGGDWSHPCCSNCSYKVCYEGRDWELWDSMWYSER